MDPVDAASTAGSGMHQVEAAVGHAVRESGASVALLYLLPPGEDVLRLSVLTGVPEQIAASWLQVALTEPIPVADAVRERRLIWISGPEEMARTYPRPALVLPYDFSLLAAPVVTGAIVWGGLVLLWPGSHPPRLRRDERELAEATCRSLGRLLEQASAKGRPVLPGKRPRVLPSDHGRAPEPTDGAAAIEFISRLPGGSCALDLDGRFTFVTPGAADMLGADEEQLLGALPWEALPWMDIAEAEDCYRSALISRWPTRFTAVRPPDTWLCFELYPDDSGISVRVTPAADTRETPAPRHPAQPAMPSRAAVLYHLMHLAATLTETTGVQDVVDQVADQLLPALDAEAMALNTAEEGRLNIIGYRGYTAELMALFDALPLSADTPAVRVMNTGVPNFFTTFADLKRAYPSVVQLDEMSSWAFLPLIASGHPIGSLVLAYDRPRNFAPGERAILTSLAGLIAQALDRARLYDAKRDLAQSLQAGLLPRTLPRLPGMHVVARYRPVGRGMGVGGDFYDLIRIDDATASAAIGDVQGHDVAAAALMGQVRTAVHAHATAGASPSEVLARTNRLLADLDPGLFTSCVYASLDLSRRRVRLASAGHPPPLLRHPDGRAEILRVPPGLLLGIYPDAEYSTTEIDLKPGALLALYTDGLVEAPGIDIDESTAEIAGHLAGSDPSDLDAVADQLIERAPTLNDDIALLLIGVDPTSL
ncbi:SpoIIE family protein phosphatase [Nocardiopsis mangrovi]|uniref:SpoIIE family protein phosphatase n=1 Tax=Nocardiopsis mangrovi TaxID=1179818 RepID=A0ABV9DSN8_9ACTN